MTRFFKLLLGALAVGALLAPNFVFAAVAFQSVQTTNPATSASVTVTKPVSLATGDLMLAQIVCYGTCTVATITAPSGWTKLRNDGTVPSVIYWKIATAGDVAAANFQWTTDGSETSGSIARFTGTDQTTPIDQSNGANDAGASPATGGITPTQANSFFVIYIASRDNGGLVRTSSGYAIVTSNPTWTEDYDTGAALGSGNGDSFAMAHGSRPQVTASGNASATRNAAVSFGSIQVLDIIPPITATAVFSITNACISGDW